MGKNFFCSEPSLPACWKKEHSAKWPKNAEDQYPKLIFNFEDQYLLLLEDQYNFCFDLILILQEQEILILQIENEFRILIPCIFLAILQSAPFFSRLVERVWIKNSFLTMVPNFKLDHLGWPHYLTFHTPFTQIYKISIKGLTIVTGHPLLHFWENILPVVDLKFLGIR